VDLAEESEVGRSHPSERPQQGHGDPGGGIRHPARRGGGDDTEANGGEGLGRRGWEMAGDVQPGRVAGCWQS